MNCVFLLNFVCVRLIDMSNIVNLYCWIVVIFRDVVNCIVFCLIFVIKWVSGWDLVMFKSLRFVLFCCFCYEGLFFNGFINILLELIF